MIIPCEKHAAEKQLALKTGRWFCVECATESAVKAATEQLTAKVDRLEKDKAWLKMLVNVWLEQASRLSKHLGDIAKELQKDEQQPESEGRDEQDSETD